MQNQRAGKVIYASSDTLPSPLAFFLAEFSHKGHKASRTPHDRDTRPSPHEVAVRGDGLPMISLKLQLEGNKQPAMRVRRKRKRRIAERTLDSGSIGHYRRNCT